MPYLLTTIAEGPREEDGRVRYQCDNCGRITNWITPPDEGGKVEHYCGSGDKKTRRPMVQRDTCASSWLNQAATALRAARDKLADQQTQYEINAILLNFPRYIRKAAAEELAQRDREDGL